MRIGVIHQFFLAPGDPGGSRFNEFARLWTAAGHEVTIIAGNRNYATGRTSPGAERRWVVAEREGDAHVVRCHVPKAYGRSYVGRMWAFLGFTFTASWAALRIAAPDVLIATSPPLVVAIPALIVCRLRRRVPWVFEIRDLWPESAVSTGVLRRGSALTRLLYVLESMACRSADVINVLTPAFRDDIVRRGLAPERKVCLVPNGADSAHFAPGPRDNPVRARLGWGERFVLLYAGAHGKANAIGQLVDAADRLRHQPEILIACVGDGPERPRWEAEAQRRGLVNIQFYGPQPKDVMPEFVNAADAGAAVLQDNPTFHTVYPNKVFDYMACARPVLLAIDGVARRLVCDEARAGVFADPESPESLTEAILALKSNPDACAELGRNGRAWILENATRESLSARYLSILERLVEGQPSQ